MAIAKETKEHRIKPTMVLGKIGVVFFCGIIVILFHSCYIALGSRSMIEEKLESKKGAHIGLFD